MRILVYLLILYVLASDIRYGAQIIMITAALEISFAMRG